MTRAQATLLLLAGLFCPCYAAQSAPQKPVTIEIKDTVNNIDSHLKALNKSYAILQTGTDRGGQVTIYRSGTDVVRIDAIIGGSNSDLQDVFYYSGANLVFVKTKTVTYPYSSRSNGFDFTVPHVKAAADYYVRDRRLIPVAHAKITASVASRLLQEAELFMTAARRQNQVIDIQKLLK
jgi:hypothetical protein